MGQQQILLIIVGIILVGIAVAVGITMFKDQAKISSTDALLKT
jgi:Tfp pilus assembly protein PilN